MCKNEVHNTVRSWADLPDELIYAIFSRVNTRARPNFLLVCKTWGSIQPSFTPAKHYFQSNILDYPCPHLFFTNKLIHPILRKFCYLDKYPQKNIGLQLHAVKADWLLFTQNHTLDTPSKAFLFNPFTQAIEWLPDPLDQLWSACITSSPTSADFKAVVARFADPANQCTNIAIDIIKHGEKNWTTSKFEFREESSSEFSYCCSNPILHKGMCCLLSKDSKLLIHNLKKKTFFLHEAPEYLHCVVREQYMLESNGKLLAVFVGTGGSWVLVCRWNFTIRKWEKVDDLGNNVLFVSRPYSLSETVGASELRNRIYFPRLVGEQCLFYSLSTKKFHTSYKSSHSDFQGSKSAFSSTWIKPTCVS